MISPYLIRHTTFGVALLVVYEDDILLIGNDAGILTETKDYFKQHFVTKNKEESRHFIGIEVAY